MPQPDDLYPAQFTKSGDSPPSPPPQGGGNTSDALLSGWDKMYGQEQSMLKEHSAEMGKATDAAISASREQSATGREALATMKGKMVDQPKPPTAQELQQNAMQWMSLSAGLAALAGAFTRNHVTNAMTAFAGFNNGLAKGNYEATQMAYQQWRNESESALRTNQQAIDEYKLTMQDAKMNLDQKMNEIQMLASKWQDEMMSSTAAQKNFTMVAQLLQSREDNQFKLQGLNEKTRQADEKVALEAAKYGMVKNEKGVWEYKPSGGAQILNWSEEAIEAAAETYNLTGKMPTNVGPRQSAGIITGAIQSRAAEKLQESGQTPQQRTQQWQQYGAQGAATKAFGAGPEGRNTRAINVAILHLGTAEQLVSALGNGDVRAINAAAQRFAQETGQPAPTNFDAARQIIGQEIVKAIITGGGSAAERQHAQDLLSRANSPQQLLGVIRTIKQLLGGQMKGLEKQYDRSTGRSDFGNRLLPETQRELGGQGAPSSGDGGWSIQPVD
jgi:hypothetical protein